MRKQITSLLLTLAMLLSLVPTLGVTASAGEMLPFYEVGTYQELRSAVLSGKSRPAKKSQVEISRQCGVQKCRTKPSRFASQK